MVTPGGKAPRRCCSTILNRDDWPLGTDETARRDLLLFLPFEADAHITNLQAKVTGQDGLAIAAKPAVLNQPAPALESRAYPLDSGPAADDGHHVKTGWVVRIPIALNPAKP